MHRTNRVVTWGVAGLLSLGFAAAATAQPQEPVPTPGQAQGQSKLSANALVVPFNVSKRVSMTSKRAIRSASIDKEDIARVQALQDDPTSVLVVGRQAGTARLRLVDDAGNEENIDVVVQIDIEIVKTVLKRAFPTAAVEPIPVGASGGTLTIVLVGTVAHAEEIEAILRVAQGVLATSAGSAAGTGTSGSITVVNAMTVGGVRQVQLDVVMASVNRTELRNFGVNFTVTGTTGFIGSLVGSLTQAGTQAGGGAGAVTGGGVTLLGPGQFLSSLTPGARTNIVAGIVPAGLNVFITALREERLAKLLAEPRLVTLSGRPATFLSGGQQAVPEVTASGVGGGTVGTRFEPFGTQLTFLPIVLGNGKIYLEVEPVISQLNANNGFVIGGVAVPGRDEQRVRTAVMMEPGQTFAVGGLIQNEVGGNAVKTPVLGDLPFIGPFFSNIAYSEQEREVVVLVTPYLVDPMDCKQAPCKLPGFETRTPDDFELFLELILEAPRGQREVFPDKRYRPAWMNDPLAEKFPCGGAQCAGSCRDGKGGSCQTGGCTSGACWAPGAVGTAPGAPPVTPVGAPSGEQESELPATTTTIYPPTGRKQ
jgi:pilus assembly protein CpaC